MISGNLNAHIIDDQIIQSSQTNQGITELNNQTS